MHVVVIGAGLVGLCSAYSLLRLGCRVTVVDRRQGAGLETSFANAGLMTPSMAQPWNTPGVHRTLLKSLVRSDSPVMVRPRTALTLGRWGLDFLRESRRENYERNTLCNYRLARYSMQVIDELYPEAAAAASLRRSGSMNLYRNAADFASGKRESRLLAEAGLRYEVLTAHGCVAQEPELAPIESKLTGGIWFPDDRSGDAFAFCRALAGAISSSGGVVRYGITVGDWYCANGVVRALETSDSRLEADAFVIAAGSYSRELARRIGIGIPVVPAKGYSLSYRSDQLTAMPRVPIADTSLHTAITPIGGVLRVAGTAEFAGFDTSVSPARTRNLQSLLAKVYPTAARPGAESTAWTGLRPMSPDGVPVIGRTRLSNVFVNTGHGHLGWTLAAGSGELLAQAVTERSGVLNPIEYSLSRSSTWS